jgi:hypothetical protein
MARAELDSAAAKALPDGTRVEVMSNGQWRVATRRITSIESEHSGYALVQMDDQTQGWSRHYVADLRQEGGWWWADHGIRILEEEGDSDMARLASPDGSTRQQFPSQPIVMDYWDPQQRNVSIDRKWVAFKTGGHTFDVFYAGQCLYCDRSTWVCADGTTLTAMGNQALVLIEDEGRKFRFCSRCAIRDGYVESTIEAHKKDKDNTGLLVWPDVFAPKDETKALKPDDILAPEPLAF